MTYRILHCLRAPVGGLFRHVRDLTAEQACAGHEVGVICDAVSADALSNPRLDELSKHLSLGLTRIAMSRAPAPSDFNVIAQTRALAQQHKVHILHGHGAKGGAYARLAARSLRRATAQATGDKISCIYTPHGGSLHYHPSSLKGRIYMNLERYLAKHTDAIAFESAYSAGVYEKQIGHPGCTTAIIPNGLLPEEFAPVIPAEDATDFLFIGELRHLKGIDTLLQAIKKIQHDGPTPITATIVGAGPDQDQFKALCSELHLNDVVHFTGALPARHAFPLGRAMVIPSRAESFPYIVLEAAAAGLPLLATNVGGIPEIVGDTDTRLLPPGDPKILATALRDFLADPVAANARAKNLKQYVADHFTVKGMAAGVNDLYDQIRRS